MKPLAIIIAILLAGMAVDLVALGLIVSHRHAIADRSDSLSCDSLSCDSLAISHAPPATRPRHE